MTQAIKMVNESTYTLSARGSEMTLRRAVCPINGEGWEMTTVNASVRAWNRGFAIPKFFKTLKDVETKYKTWKGIEALITL